MQNFENSIIVKNIIRSLIDVISRRTSEGYAIFTVENVLKKLGSKYNFLNLVEIKTNQFEEAINVINVDSEINNVSSSNLKQASIQLIKVSTEDIGKNAGYFFLKEVKEDLPYDFEEEIRGLGIDFDLLQLDYITEKKKTYKLHIPHSDVLHYVFSAIFNIMENEISRDFAFSTIPPLIDRMSTQYQLLKYIKINDTRFIQDAKMISISPKVDSFDNNSVASTIQKIIQEVNTILGEEYGILFIEKLRSYLTFDYIFRLEEIGVDLQVIPLRQSLVIKQLVKTIVDVLADGSSQSYAVYVLDIIMSKLNKKGYIPFFLIDNNRYTEGLESIVILPTIDSISSVELGRSIQHCLEHIIILLGESAGKQFLDKFKKHLGNAFLLRIERMGVNLHIIQIKQNMLW